MREWYALLLGLILLVTSPPGAASDLMCMMAPQKVRQILAESGKEPAIEAAMRIIGSPDTSKEELQASIAFVSCNAGSEHLDALISLLKHPDSEIRQQVLAAGTKIHDVRWTSPALAIISDESQDFGQRLMAAVVLSGSTPSGKEAAAAIAELASDTSLTSHSRVQIVIALGEMDPAVSAERLTSFFEDSDPDIAGVAAVQLARQGNVAAVPVLVATILSPDSQLWTKHDAANQLESIAGFEFDFNRLDGDYSGYAEAQGQIAAWYELHRHLYEH